MIVGAGLAGCYLARELAERGWSISLLDEQAAVAQRASANPQALLFPPSSLQPADSLSKLLQLGFDYTRGVLPVWFQAGVPGAQQGIIKLASRSREEKHMLITPEVLSDLAGIPLNKPGQFFSQAAWINLPAWCEALINHPLIKLQLNQTFSTLPDDGSVVILAMGTGTLEQPQWARLQAKKIRGQLTWVRSNAQSELLKLPLCGKGHILPAREGVHLVGATYDHKLETLCDKESDRENLARLSQFGLELKQVERQWADARLVTSDYLPCVGGMVEPNEFMTKYQALKKDPKRVVKTDPPWIKGFYTFTGFGSKGVTTIPLLSHWFAQMLSGERSAMPQEWIKSLSPSRFLLREIMREMI